MSGKPQLIAKHSVPVNVLVIETIAAFGYDPQRLKKTSNLIVICFCPICKIIREKALNSAHTLCLRCSNKINGRSNLEAHSKNMKNFWKTHVHSRTGVKHTKSARVKISNAAKLRPPMSDIRRQEFSVMNSGEGNPFYGKHHKESSKRYGKDNTLYGKIPAHTYKCWHTNKEGEDVCFRSTWEKAVAIYLDSRNIKWSYESTLFEVFYEIEGKQFQGTYRPDFYLPDSDEYIEIKGRWRTYDKIKFTAFLSQYKKVKISVWGEKELKRRRLLLIVAKIIKQMRKNDK